ncbi:hypothetical protein C8N43_1135 [Litoreibacter ponti]|uniref:Thymidylate synthase n=1 Tax=Litoreibacter ponti TaxID=1510457 RepID=A0A2T6BKA3_9RHOB|nr:hypothetical protein [Litoreibacter ponti]PTX56476.1 hypothetical protein C8N43_1135 [Litoreibacter ponti]
MNLNYATKAIGILSISALMACGGGGAGGSNPVTGGPNAAIDPVDPVDPTAPTINGIPTELANNLLAVTFDPGSGNLLLELQSFDAPGESGIYVRNPAIDSAINGYQAYTRQDDPNDRFFLAINGVSAGGEVRAVAVTDGGQFNRFFGGGFYEQDGSYSAPRTTGLVSYAGRYAATTNLNATGANLLPQPPGSPPPPREPATIEGDIFINLSFSDNGVNGQIFNREFSEYPAITLPDIRLVEGVLNADGSFLGDTEIEVERRNGAFGGTLGGEDGTALAGVTSISDFSDDLDNEAEYGIFVLERCGTANEDAALCAGSNP